MMAHGGMFSVERNQRALPATDRDALLQNPGFGKTFSDHMFVMDYDADSGWHGGVVKPRGPFQVDPACSILHYAQEIFEGMKAFRTPDGGGCVISSKRQRTTV